MLITKLAASAPNNSTLFASVIKRQTGAKDYGNIMPGHGGMMDRLDSIGISMPFVYAVLCFAFKIFSIG